MHESWTPKIGLFDSGIGGFTVLRHVLSACPGVPCLYVGDVKHVPYGPRTLNEIHEIAAQLIEFLRSEGCTHIVVACNTSSAALKDQPLNCGVPILNVIDPLAAWLTERPGLRRLGVVANPVTAARQIHAQVLEEVRSIQVTTIPAPTLVSLLEANRPEGELTEAVALLAPELIEARVEGIIYGCTHYPLAAESFRHCFGPGVELIDSGTLIAQELAQLLPEPTPDAEPGPVEFITTAESADFGRWIQTLFPAELEWTLRTHDCFRQPLAV